MSQTEFSRASQQPNRRRPLVGLVIVVVLCLTAFALGIFVGKQRQKIAEADESSAPVTHPVASKPVAVTEVAPVVATVDGRVVASELTQVMAGAEQKSVEAVVVGHQLVEDAAVLVEPTVTVVEPPPTSVSVAKIASIEQSPLGSGLNSAPVIPKADVDSEISVSKAVTAVTSPVVVSQSVVKAKSAVVPSSAVYVVQVGSFKKRADAEKLQIKLQKDFLVVVRSVDLGVKGVWYRVLVGQSATKDTAVKLQGQLQSRYKMAGFVKKTTI